MRHPERVAAVAVNEGSELGEANSAALCLHPSARDPPPIDDLLQTNTELQFDRTVTGQSNLLFGHFAWSNRCHLTGHFAVVTLCRCIGRQWVAAFKLCFG
jgi:hypothetical protein